MHAYILAGGKSSRFGSNKAFALWKETPFLVYQHQFLSCFFEQVHIIAEHKHQYRNLGFEALTDRYKNKGPLAGLETALQHAKQNRQEWLFLASCDTFDVTLQQIKELQQCCNKQAALYTHNKQIEPLWGFYAVTIEHLVIKQLQKQDYALQNLIKKIDVNYKALSTPWIQINSVLDSKLKQNVI